MKYYIEIGTVNKAKRDIDEICRQEGYTNLTRHNFGNGGAGRFFTKLFAVCSILFCLKKNDILILQYPMKKFYKTACRLARIKGAKVVGVIHDLGAFRRKKLTPEQENRRLSLTDFLIVHNATMRDYLLEHGFKEGIHCLQIFDYISNREPNLNSKPGDPWQVVYAGSLGSWRSGFLYKLKECVNSYDITLYGRGFDKSRNKCPHLYYQGFVQSDEFISIVKADFGLVWDGDSLDECNGDWGEYLKINNPHKTSFYLRAGIPVIVWSKAAMAPFVKKENIGIAVNSLKDIKDILATLSTEEYAKMKTASKAMCKRLAQGYYFKEGLKSAWEYLGIRN